MEYGFSVVCKMPDGSNATYAFSPGKVNYYIDGVFKGWFIWLSGITVNAGQRLKLYAEANPNFYFSHYDINGKIIRENPYEFQPAGGGYIHAYFSETPPHNGAPSPSQPTNGSQNGQIDNWWILLIIVLLAFIAIMVTLG